MPIFRPRRLRAATLTLSTAIICATGAVSAPAYAHSTSSLPTPPPPTLSVSPQSARIGGLVRATITTSGCGSVASPCPATYSVQVDGSAPFDVTAGTDVSHASVASIIIRRAGWIQISATGIAADANDPASQTVMRYITGSIPASPYVDGHFTGGRYSDLVSEGTGANPSLWLYKGTGHGRLSQPVDIGSLGVTGGSSGPSEWAGFATVTGDFTGDHVQDVLAYRASGPFMGVGVIIAGDGRDGSLVSGGRLIDRSLMANAAGAEPSQLVDAGNPGGLDDLIGISGGNELDLYTGPNSSYGFVGKITGSTPDGTADWGNYSIAAAHTSSATTLFAVRTTTGALYTTTGPFTVNANLTWTRVSVPWGRTPPKLASGDINDTGNVELWTFNGAKPVPFVLSGRSLVAENPSCTLNSCAESDTMPRDDWPLTNGTVSITNPNPIDTITGAAATLSAGANWVNDDYFLSDISLNGTSGYITPPASTIPKGYAAPTISIWFKTTKPGVLVSVQASPVSSASTTTGTYDPVLYVGTDGKLNAEWWNGSATPIVSTSRVNDGTWHHATLVTTYESAHWVQTLRIDGRANGSLTGAVTGNWNNLTFGAGFIGGPWPDEAHHGQRGNTGYLEYLSGQVAAATFR